MKQCCLTLPNGYPVIIAPTFAETMVTEGVMMSLEDPQAQREKKKDNQTKQGSARPSAKCAISMQGTGEEQDVESMVL